jgi:gamma-glutamyl phosphate reductase
MLENIFKAVQKASRSLGLLAEDKINKILLSLAEMIESKDWAILAEKKKDLDRMA